MLKSNNVNIASRSLLSPPGAVRSELPLSLDAVMKVVSDRQTVMDILDGRDKRIMMIVGPCSIHDPAAAIEYAELLKKLSEDVADRFYIIMRTYF